MHIKSTTCENNAATFLGTTTGRSPNARRFTLTSTAVKKLITKVRSLPAADRKGVAMAIRKLAHAGRIDFASAKEAMLPWNEFAQTLGVPGDIPTHARTLTT